jgi:hypothetical protein
MEEDGADRASSEIKALLRKLDPDKTSHKDRIRRLNKFRNFCSGEGVSACRNKEEGSAISLTYFANANHYVLLFHNHTG